MSVHLARGQGALGRFLGETPRVLCLAPDVRRDAGHAAVGAVRPGAVSDVEVEAAVRGDEDRLARDGEIAQGGRGDGEGQAERERRGLPAPAGDPAGERQGGREAEAPEKRVRPVESEEPQRRSREGPVAPSGRFQGPRHGAQAERHQEWVERRLEKDRLVKDDGAREREEAGRGERRLSAEPGPGGDVEQPHRGRAEEDLEDLDRDERAAGQSQRRGEEVDVQGSEEEGLAPGRGAQEEVPAGHLPGQGDVRAAVELPDRLQERVIVELPRDHGADSEREAEDAEETPPRLGDFHASLANLGPPPECPRRLASCGEVLEWLNRTDC